MSFVSRVTPAECWKGLGYVPINLFSDPSQTSGSIVVSGTPGATSIDLSPGVLDLLGTLSATLNTTVALAAGDFVSVGASGLVLADASLGLPAHGFVTSAWSANTNALMYMFGFNNFMSALVLGTRYFLSTAGLVTSTVPTSNYSQELGVAVSPTSLLYCGPSSLMVKL